MHQSIVLSAIVIVYQVTYDIQYKHKISRSITSFSVQVVVVACISMETGNQPTEKELSNGQRTALLNTNCYVIML